MKPKGDTMRRWESKRWQDFQSNLGHIYQNNNFQRNRFPDLANWGAWRGFEDFSQACPFTTKIELEKDRLLNPPHGTNFTYSTDQYLRFSRTSGTSGVSMAWLDTREDWKWMLGNWDLILQMAGVIPGSNCFFTFSFGPFLGFWTAYEAALHKGCLCIPGGGLSSESRLNTILRNQVEYLFCTPTYALRLLETAKQNEISLQENRLKKIIVAGECGGSNQATRKILDHAWDKDAVLFDHYGMTEVGPVAYEIPGGHGGLRILQDSYYAEVVHCESLLPVEDGELGELILTPLGRTGAPVLRYRTGDLVRANRDIDDFGLPTFDLVGGILGRTDDMVIIRGVNLYPSAIDSIVRKVPGISEYQVLISSSRGMKEARIRAECEKSVGLALENAIHDAFSLRIPVECVAPEALPRVEMKAKRWITE